MKTKYGGLMKKALNLGAQEAKIMSTGGIVFDSRAFLKCRFGCNRWGRYWTCPPHTNFSPQMFQEAFSNYKEALFIRTADPKSGQEIAVALEKEAMLSYGSQFAFAMAMCVQCEACAYPEPCRYPHLARPSMDGFGVDIGKTLEPLGFKVDFDKKGNLLPAWYSMVLLD